MFAKDISTVKLSLKNELIYKMNFFINMLYMLIPTLSSILLWGYIYHSVDTIGNYNKSAMYSYYVMAYIVGNILNVGLNESAYVDEIKNGSVIKYFMKPYQMIRYMFFSSLKNIGMFIGLSLIPLSVLVLCLHEYIQIQSNPILYLILLLSLAGGYCIHFLLKILVVALAFYIDNVSCLPKAINTLKQLVGGSLIPIDLFPAVLHRVLALTPFQYLGYFQVTLLIKHIGLPELLKGLLLEFLWVLVLYVVTKAVWASGRKRYSAFGG